MSTSTTTDLKVGSSHTEVEDSSSNICIPVPTTKRIYIGGLHESITEDNIKDRFHKYGEIVNVDVAKDCENHCRGFAHMSIVTTPKQWAQCISVYNGAKWKGKELKLEEAKADYLERKRLREEQLLEKEERKKKRVLRCNDSEGFHAKDMTPITDNNMNGKRYWRRGRYGRAVSVMRLRKPDGSIFVYEPTLYKNNLMKLFNIGVRMKPVNQLINKIGSDESDAAEEVYTDDDSVDYDHNSQDIHDDDEKRRLAIENRLQEQKRRNELISRSLAGEVDQTRTNHVNFEIETEDNTAEINNEIDEVVVDNPSKKEDMKWMFDSDDESDEEYDIKINPVLEGEAGRKRLQLQSRFKGDERFKLDKDFIDEEEEKERDLGDEISRDLAEEKDQALDVLRSLFGDEKINRTAQKPSSQWTDNARFDPDDEESTRFIVNKPDITNILKEINNDKEDEEEDRTDQNVTQSVMPVVSTEKHYEVNTNLKPLFGGSEAVSFSMFGNDEKEEENEVEQIAIQQPDTLTSHPIVHQKKGSVGLGMFFFFHMDNPVLLKKSCYSYDKEGIFQLKEDKEDYIRDWKVQRTKFNDVLRKRQRFIMKNQKKRATKDLK
ncbi:hypothetical protein BDB01DRAFT_845385 [Pilobolus umbonatus]|nr:hypothetical protein BDB01DRAFT_845385 [Pilobolus umbonatus]